MVFTGTYDHSIDAKNRLAIPAEVRAQVQEEVDRRNPGSPGLPGAPGSSGGESGQPIKFYVTLGEGQSLSLYTEHGFEQRAAELDNSSLSAEELLTYERIMFSLTRRVEMDKQGRILVPENLLAMTGLKGDVVLLGVKDHLEIRDRQAWQDHVKQLLSQNPQILMNPRRAMRPAPRTSGQGQDGPAQ